MKMVDGRVICTCKCLPICLQSMKHQTGIRAGQTFPLTAEDFQTLCSSFPNGNLYERYPFGVQTPIALGT